MTFSLIFFIIYSFLNLSLIFSQETCHYSMYCESNPSNICMNIIQTESDQIYKIGFSPCETQRASYCNVYDPFIQPLTFPQSTCIPRPKILQSYTGGSCEDDSDCIYGICLNNKCIDSDRGKKCFIDENCPIGTACMPSDDGSYKCEDLKGYGDSCLKSTHCQYNYYCVFDHCLHVFDLDDGTDLTQSASDPDEKMDLACKSGYAAIINDIYICARTKNKNPIDSQCYQDCQYQSNREVVTIMNSCRCGFNYERSKHCILGSGEDAYVQYIEAKKKLFDDPSYTQYCHTLERYNEEQCVEKIKTERSVSGRHKIKEYNDLRLKALEHHRLVNADNCIKTVVFDHDPSPIIPDKRTCAKFTCNKKLKVCAYGENPLNEEGDNVTMVLNDNVCQKGEMCLTSHNKGIDFIYENYTMIGECKVKPSQFTIRLPGEDCYDGNQCLNTKCGPDNKCLGASINKTCSNHDDCIVGLSCWKGTCQKQKKEGEECMTGWDCLNYLGCYATVGSTVGKCTHLGLVGDIEIKAIKEKWTVFPDIHHNYDPSLIGTSLMCKNGQLSVTQTKCGEYRYDTDIEAMKDANENHFIECQADEDCYYKDNYDASITKKCECGYNSQGKGYCPLPNSINKEEWLELTKLKSDLTDNNCHTLSRFNCYLNSISSDISELELRTSKAHLFYKAVPCAYTILSSGFNTINYIAFASIVILLLY